jgi:hypothetical protein
VSFVAERNPVSAARCFNKTTSAAETSKAAADLAAAEALAETQSKNRYIFNFGIAQIFIKTFLL